MSTIADPSKPKRKKRNVASEEPISVSKELIDFIHSHELDWWLNKTPRNDARKQVNKDCIGINIPAKQWPNIVYWRCKIYGQWKRKNSSAKDLDFRGWEKLKAAVEALQPMMQGRLFTEALSIVKSQIACNAALLKGLPGRFHYWL